MDSDCYKKHEKVQVGKDQEMAQSAKDSHILYIKQNTILRVRLLVISYAKVKIVL